MAAHDPYRTQRHLLAFAVAMLAGVALCPSAAHASCGDWLAHQATVGSDGEGAAEAAHATTDQQGPLQPAIPCRGPHCRNVPENPLSVPVDRPTTLPEVKCAALADRLHDEAPARGGRLFEPALAPSEGHRLKIERPPQLPAATTL